MPTEVNELLHDVRNSYRFLFNYQKRILDLIGFIGGSFGVSYAGGYTKFSGPTPRNGKGYLSSWAWDWLPFYFYEFNFEKFKAENDEIVFPVFLLNDTGYFQVDETSKVSKTEISAFEDSGQSSSKLIFTIGKNLWEEWGSNWHADEFVLKEFGIKIKDENKIMIFKSYNLEYFSNEDSTLSKLKDFEDFCAENNSPFNIKKRKF